MSVICYGVSLYDGGDAGTSSDGAGGWGLVTESGNAVGGKRSSEEQGWKESPGVALANGNPQQDRKAKQTGEQRGICQPMSRGMTYYMDLVADALKVRTYIKYATARKYEFWNLIKKLSLR